MKTIGLTAWRITTTHGSDWCEDCRWAVRRAEDRIESGRALDNTFTLIIRNSGHDAAEKRRDA
jgi:hypothetical protein